jgi:DNA-binding NarL/FixJ family response regulator
MIRLALGDDHPIVVEGLRAWFQAQPGMRVVGVAGDAPAVRDVVRSGDLDVLVLDLSLPGGGLDFVRELVAAYPRVGIVVFTMHPEDALALHYLEAGARAYLNKQRPLPELAEAVRRAASLRRHLTGTLAELSAEGREGQPHERLTPREHEVFRMLVEGRRVSDIADHLDISVSTASNHLSKVREKLGVSSNGEVLLYAQRVGLLG